MSLFRKVARSVALQVPGVRWLKQRFIDPYRIHHSEIVAERPADRGPAPVIATDELVRAYEGSEASRKNDSFILYRIIGNDLTPRHRLGQSRTNLEFILENEPELPNCEKRFVVNRIADPDEEQRILDLLEKAGAPYLHIPFRWNEYEQISWDVEGVPTAYAPYTKRFALLDETMQGRIMMRLYRHKNNYVMNNNGARNAALRDGRGRAKWVLPWDGNCFVTREGWEEIQAAVTAKPEVPYWLVPMARITDNNSLLEDDFRPVADEEPQILFRCDTDLEFNPEYFYGRRPKVELFWRLGVADKWDRWPIELWDLPCPDYAQDAGAYSKAGWVARLFSGQAHLEKTGSIKALSGRGLARVEAVRGLIDSLDEKVAGSRLRPDATVFLNSGEDQGTSRDDDAGLLEQLKAAADDALTRGPYSVVDKTSLPPSRNRHDYWHPAPYYWPHPLRIPGLPYVKRDGMRVPGTRLYEPLSEMYDRTRLQRLFEDTFVLTLAYVKHGDERHAEHAARLVRHWFLDPATAMNPHLQYAQVRRGHDRNRGNNSGIIEMKDLYYFLDAVRVLSRDGVLDDTECERFASWMREYLSWLQDSPQGQAERSTVNNHGTYYDLQLASIAAFLGEHRLLLDTLRDSRLRILQQFDTDGCQPEEMRRTTTAHYCCFNLQGWVHLAELADSVGEDLWSFEGPGGVGLRKAMELLLQHIGKEWPYPQLDEFDDARFYPIYHAFCARYGLQHRVDGVPDANRVKPLFHPHDGVRPFWQL